MVPRLPPTGLITPNAVYLDDAGCNAKFEPDFMFAGYWAPVGFWGRFGDAWNKILDRKPSLPYWHSSAALKRADPFHVLSDAQYRKRRDALYKLIGDNIHDKAARAGCLAPLCVRVAHADIKSLVADKITMARPLTSAERDVWRTDIMERPHFITLYHASKLLIDLNLSLGDDMLPLSVFCEQSAADPYQGHMSSIWSNLKRWRPKWFGTLDFPPGKTRQCPQVQAADVLAWHINCAAKGKPEPTWLIVSGGPTYFEHRLDRSLLADYTARWNRLDPS